VRQDPDSLRVVLRGVFTQPEYRWVEPGDPWHGVRWLYHVILRWTDALGRAHPRLTAGFEVLAGLMLVAAAFRAALVLFRSVGYSGADREEGATGPAVRRDQAWYRAEAARLAQAGRFPEAMQHDFLALVLALDAHQLLRFHPSRTPAEYARAVDLSADRAAAFSDLVRRLYLHVFARVPLDRDGFTAWRDDAQVERFAPAH
jgi:hypothetical protein